MLFATRLLLCLLLLAPLTSCRAVNRLALSTLYDRVDLPAENVRRDLVYVDGSDDPKHRLNLFLPLSDSVRRAAWPTVVFVHGGGWTEGDRDLHFGGEEIYNNIGRFFAAHGIGAANVSYRLQPQATWREQVADVARAVAEARRQVDAYGGDPDALVLMGHSAGAYLTARVALDAEAQKEAGLPGEALCGVMPISGAAFDLRDRRAFEIGENFDYYGVRFGPSGETFPELMPDGPPAAWQTDASIVPLLTDDAPPFLVVHAEKDYPALLRQNDVLLDALADTGVAHDHVVVPGSSHIRIVPLLSRPDHTPGPALLAFVRNLDCS